MRVIGIQQNTFSTRKGSRYDFEGHTDFNETYMLDSARVKVAAVDWSVGEVLCIGDAYQIAEGRCAVERVRDGEFRN